MAVFILPLGYTMLGLQRDKFLGMYNVLTRKSSQSNNYKCVCVRVHCIVTLPY